MVAEDNISVIRGDEHIPGDRDSAERFAVCGGGFVWSGVLHIDVAAIVSDSGGASPECFYEC